MSLYGPIYDQAEREFEEEPDDDLETSRDGCDDFDEYGED